MSLDRLIRVVHRRGFGDADADALVLLAILERVPYTVLVLGYLDEPDAVAASEFMIRRALFATAGT